MPLLTIIVVLMLVGLALWAINTYIPMQLMVKRILNFTVVIILILWLLKVFGLLAGLGAVRI